MAWQPQGLLPAVRAVMRDRSPTVFELKDSSFTDMSGWTGDDHDAALAAVVCFHQGAGSLPAFPRFPSTAPSTPGHCGFELQRIDDRVDIFFDDSA